jgi:hypothetical protein
LNLDLAGGIEPEPIGARDAADEASFSSHRIASRR